MNKSLVRTSILILLFLVGSSFATHSRADAGLSVVGHKALEAGSLTLKELRSIFTMKRILWPSGQAVKVFVLENDHELHKQFCMGLLGVFPRQLESVWYRLVYSGTGNAPVKVDSEEELLKLVSETPGSIGYLDNKKINDHVKVIEIER